jgi:hypothetical protein
MNNDNSDKTRPLRWGLQPPTQAPAWAARAIPDRSGRLDLLSDRQDAVGDKTELVLLDRALGRLLPAARRQWRLLSGSGLVVGDEARRVCLANDGQYAIEADTRGSCGYVYLVCYRIEAPSEVAELLHAPGTDPWHGGPGVAATVQLQVCLGIRDDEPCYAVAYLDGDRVVLSGSRTGEHSLLLQVSSPERVSAHFAGYCQTALDAEVAS